MSYQFQLIHSNNGFRWTWRFNGTIIKIHINFRYSIKRIYKKIILAKKKLKKLFLELETEVKLLLLMKNSSAFFSPAASAIEMLESYFSIKENLTM